MHTAREIITKSPGPAGGKCRKPNRGDGANHAFQAVEVPAGQHEITLRYEDWAFRLGAAISALTLLGCLTGLLMKPGH